MKEFENILYTAGIVPVIKISDAAYAVNLAKALVNGGILTTEVTFRTSAAAESIYKMRESYPDMLIGAGTVLTKDSLDAAILAGAQFIVSPGFNPAIVEGALSREIPIIPGCMTPTEIERAMSFGLDFVKFFPAEAAGGVKFLKAVSAPYSDIKFMPTGGVTLQNAKEYLLLKSVLCCGTSSIATDEQITAGMFEKITENAAAYRKLISEIRQKN